MILQIRIRKKKKLQIEVAEDVECKRRKIFKIKKREEFKRLERK